MSELLLEFCPLSALPPAPLNPRQHDLGAIILSIQTHGFRSPVVVDSVSGRLAAGHGRVAALTRMKAEGEPVPDGVRVTESGEWAIPCAVAPCGPGFLLADNRVGDLADNDQNVLAAMLKALAADGKLPGTGYDEDDLDKILRDLQADEAGAAGRGAAKPEVTIKIQCTKAQLEEVRPVLDEWRGRGIPVEVHVED